MVNKDLFDWIKALSPMLSVLVTIVYVVLTYKLIKIPHMTDVKLIDIDIPEYKNIKVKVKNIGHYIAKNIQIYAVVNKDFEHYPKNTFKKFLTIEKYIKAHGPYDIQPGEEKVFEYINDGISIPLHRPFIIKWETITGHKQKSRWKYFINKERIVDLERFVHVNKFIALTQWFAIKKNNLIYRISNFF